MTLNELRNMVMFQTNNDADDLGEFEPALDGYLNEGYDILLEAYTGIHLDEDENPPMAKANDEPNLPLWCQRAIADYATYLVYRNGNVTKQNRSVPYYQFFTEMLGKVRLAKLNDSTRNIHFHNLYVDV